MVVGARWGGLGVLTGQADVRGVVALDDRLGAADVKEHGVGLHRRALHIGEVQVPCVAAGVSDIGRAFVADDRPTVIELQSNERDEDLSPKISE